MLAVRSYQIRISVQPAVAVPTSLSEGIQSWNPVGASTASGNRCFDHIIIPLHSSALSGCRQYDWRHTSIKPTSGTKLRRLDWKRWKLVNVRLYVVRLGRMNLTIWRLILFSFLLQVGTPPQPFQVLPSISGQAIYVPIDQDCARMRMNITDCGFKRGVDVFESRPSLGFQKNKSSTWEELGTFGIGLGNNLGLRGSAYYGYDKISIGSSSGEDTIRVEKIAVSAYSSPDFWVGQLGLSSGLVFVNEENQPRSFLNVLKDKGKIPSLSFGYQAGSPDRKSLSLLDSAQLNDARVHKSCWEPNTGRLRSLTSIERDTTCTSYSRRHYWSAIHQYDICQRRDIEPPKQWHQSNHRHQYSGYMAARRSMRSTCRGNRPHLLSGSRSLHRQRHYESYHQSIFTYFQLCDWYLNVRRLNGHHRDTIRSFRPSGYISHIRYFDLLLPAATSCK